MKITIVLLIAILLSCSEDPMMDVCSMKRAEVLQAYRDAQASPIGTLERAELVSKYGRLKIESMNCGE